jgi:hypothetical protein
MSVISSASGSVLITSGGLTSNYSGSVAYGPKQILDGLVLYVDAANPLSYPGSGNLWFDLTKNGYSGSLSGSAAVIPSWDSTHQGRIHVEASSSYVPPGIVKLTPMSSSYINFGRILDNKIINVGSQTSIPISAGSGGGTTVKADGAIFTLNLWFEVDYSKQIVQSAFGGGDTRAWYPNYGGNIPMLVSKWADNNIIESPGFQTNPRGENRQFYLGLITDKLSFNPTTGTPLPDPIDNPYFLTFNYFAIPTNASSGIGGASFNIKSLQYAIPDKTPINICVVYNSTTNATNRLGKMIEIYFNGYPLPYSVLKGVSVTLTGDVFEALSDDNEVMFIYTDRSKILGNQHQGSNAQLALGAAAGATPRVLEGAVNAAEGDLYFDATGYRSTGTAFQSDTYFHLFQVYNRALTPQEAEQNYWAHRYRFRPWQTL